MNFVLSVHNVIEEHNSVSCSTSSFLSCSKNKSLSFCYLLAQFGPVASLLGQKQMVILCDQALVPYFSLTQSCQQYFAPVAPTQLMSPVPYISLTLPLSSSASALLGNSFAACSGDTCVGLGFAEVAVLLWLQN